MTPFGGRNHRHRLSSKLRFLNAVTGLAFLLLSAGIVATFIIVKNQSVDVMKQDMDRVAGNSNISRELSILFSDIHLLNRTFYRKDDYLRSEGQRLATTIEKISKSVRDPQLQTRLTGLSDRLGSFLAQCTRVNAVLHAQDQVFTDIEQGLTNLENLISRLLVDATLSGEDTSYITQQLTLVIGFRESVLSIAKLNAELDLGSRTSIESDHNSPILSAIDDLALRLQTLSASAPEVAQHGELIENHVKDLRKAISDFFVETDRLNEKSNALDSAKLSALSQIEEIDRQIAATAQSTAATVEEIFSFFGLAIVALSIIVIIAIHVATRNIIRFNINEPMQSVLNGIQAFSNGRLDQKIALSRVDEWDAIEKSLNSMATDLLTSRTELQAANEELEERVRVRTAKLAQTVSALWQSESSLVEAQRIAHLGHWSWKVDNGEAEWSEELYRILGFASNETQPSYELFVNRIHPDDRKRVQAAFSEALENKGRFAMDYRIVRGDGKESWIESQGHVVEDEQGHPVKISGTSLDITERKRMENLVIEEKERALVTLKSIGDAVISTDARGRVEYLNPVAEKMTGYGTAEAKGQVLDQVFNIVNEETREKAEDPVTRCLAEGKVVGLANHTVLLSRTGEEYAIQDSAAPIKYPNGETIGVVLVFSDVTRARQLSHQIAYQASHDALTGLINRHEFERRLARVLETAKTSATDNALCYLDLDQFKLVNDTCGHMAGDELLRQIANLFKESVRYRDSFARLGGDEFGLLMEHCSLHEAEQVARKMIEALTDFDFYWGGKRFAIGVSIGLVPINEFTVDVDSTLSAADTACYMAKDQGRNRIHIYKEDDEELNRRHGEMRWAVQLPHALDEGNFRLFFQRMTPVAGIGAEGQHYEVLLRLQDDHIVMPQVFFPAADRYNLSSKLDRWVVAETFQWIADHPDHLADLFLCAINLSGHSLNEEAFVTFVQQQFRDLPIPPGKICFEITETAAIANLSRAASFMKTLKTQGCRFALDDFGSGLSSFAYLRSLPVDFLKIDGVFVKDIVHDSVDMAIVKSINEIGKVMGKQTVAEFVENEEILRKLRDIGVNYAQGYGIARPQPIDELLKEW